VPYYCVEDARAILNGDEDDKQEPGYKRAAEFLRQLLAAGPRTCRDVMQDARAAGFTRQQLKQGKGYAGVLSERAYFFESGLKSWWHLPGQQVPQAPREQGTVAAEVRPQMDAGNAGGKTPRRAGRPRSSTTEDLYRACFEAYTREAKLTIALLRVQARHGARAPKEEATLRLYARRYAERRGLVLKRPNA
jgi:hypothetical protein